MYRSVPGRSPVKVKPSTALHVGHAEIGDPELSFAVQEDVRRLDVAVHDPLVVGVRDRLGRLDP